MTERQKYLKEAIELAEGIGISPANVSVVPIKIPHRLYLESLKYMDDDHLVSHYKECLEEDLFEQASLVKEQLDYRKIEIVIN